MKTSTLFGILRVSVVSHISTISWKILNWEIRSLPLFIIVHIIIGNLDEIWWNTCQKAEIGILIEAGRVQDYQKYHGANLW